MIFRCTDRHSCSIRIEEEHAVLKYKDLDHLYENAPQKYRRRYNRKAHDVIDEKDKRNSSRGRNGCSSQHNGSAGKQQA